MGQIYDFCVLPAEFMELKPHFWHADVSWPHSEVIGLWSGSVDFCNFGANFT